MAKGEGGEEFAGSAGADGGVVLEGDELLEKRGIVTGEPGKAEPGEAVGFADGAEADGAAVEVAGGGKAVGGIVFKFAIDLVGKNANVVASGKIENASEDFRAHEKAGRIMRGVDVDGAGVGADQRFESGKIMGPIVFGFAAPFTDGGSGAFGKGERAFVARRFDDGVVRGREERVIEEEDGFFGGGDDDELGRGDGFIDGGEGFAEPGRAGGFGVAAPVLEKGVVGAGFEGE